MLTAHEADSLFTFRPLLTGQYCPETGIPSRDPEDRDPEHSPTYSAFPEVPLQHNCPELIAFQAGTGS